MSWLTDWVKRIKLTIDYTKVDTTLVDFPISITLSSSTGITNVDTTSVFTTISGNSKKIAITTDDGLSQCYTEIERWDADNQEANLWTKVPTITSGTDTILYLYYDNSKNDNTGYVGTVNSTPGQTVWSNGFLAVYHMNQDPSGGADCIKNSKSISYRGTPQGGMTSDDLVDGKIGKAIDFDGAGDYIDVPNGFGMDGLTEFSVSYIIKSDLVPPAGGTYPGIFSRGLAADRVPWSYASAGSAYITLEFETTLGGATDGSKAIEIAQDEFTACDFCWDGTNFNAYKNGTKYGATDTTTGHILADSTGEDYIGYVNGYNTWDGIIEEVRVSNVSRSAAWVEASFHSAWNSLITYGSEQIRPIFLFNGYVEVEGTPAARTVHLFRRSTGELMDTTVSSGTNGYFEVGSYHNDYHFIVILPELIETYNLLAYDKIDPGV